jgi:hypothetical protein
MDLTDELNAIETSTAELPAAKGDWTHSRMRHWLDHHGIKYKAVKNTNTKPPRDDEIQYNINTCPLCGEGEGNPAVWLHNGKPCFKCFYAEPGCNDTPQKTFADLLAKFPEPKLVRISALDLPKKYPHPRKSVVNGLLRHGDVANVIGGPKARKSFLMMQLALCIASGKPFLTWNTLRGRVLLIDNELRGDDLAYRLQAMAKAMGLEWADVAANIDIMPLRGTLADLEAIRDELSELLADTYSLVVIDALYKSLPRGIDENSNSEMTSAYILLDQAAEKHNCALTVVHHTSKGSQHAKSVSDMGAGAGAQSRSADVHIVLRDHEDENTIVLQAILRSQKPIEPVCLTFDFPLWQVATNKNPANVAIANKKPIATMDEFLETIPLEPLPKNEVLSASKLTLGVSKGTITALLHEATKRKLIIVEKPANKILPHTICRVTAA